MLLYQSKDMQSRTPILVIGMRLKASYTRVYLKTEDVPGSEDFSRCARHFFAGILTYFKEK